MAKNILITLLACLAAAPSAAATFVAARHIRAGEAVTAEALREMESLPGDPALAAGELEGKEAVRPIRAGEKVSRLLLRPARAVRPGDKIRVRAAAGRVSVRAWFVALQGAAVGETIEARNQASGRVCSVKVEGPGEAYMAEVEK
jgi:flagella basal body P-ring formation protein FlgA